ncbi:MAG: hypothetical protein AAF694_29925 [Bacteroidota bacterium]
MKTVSTCLFAFLFQLTLHAQDHDSFKFDYLVGFVNKIDGVFSRISDSETQKKLKRACSYLISDLDELQFATDNLRSMFIRDTADNWLNKRWDYSDQIGIIYSKNRAIYERVYDIRGKFLNTLENEELEMILNIKNELSSRSSAIDNVERFLENEKLNTTDKHKILEKLVFIDSKAKEVFLAAHNLRRSVLDKIE